MTIKNSGIPASGASIVIPDYLLPEPDAFLRMLREQYLLLDGTHNKNERAEYLIALCIEDGRNTRRKILSALSKVGADPRHGANVLKFATGNNKSWQRDVEGTYFLNHSARI